ASGIGTAIQTHNFRPTEPQPLSAVSPRTAVNHDRPGCGHQYFSSLLAFIESEPTIDLLVGLNVRSATLVDEHDLTEVTTLSFECTFTSSDSDVDGIEILDTDFRVNDDLENGYVFALAPEYDCIPV
ncbi:MAG: hypothetical protein OXD50_16720, partial [Chloroflexi bacterium]|nr:hypothetical protein [Chloroflexota bacterium]